MSIDSCLHTFSKYTRIFKIMEDQQNFLRELLSQDGQRAAGLLSSDSETDHDRDSQLDSSLPAPPVSSENDSQQIACNACAPDDKVDAQQRSPFSLPNEPAEGSKRSKLDPYEFEKAARFRKAIVCFRCKVGKAGVVRVIVLIHHVWSGVSMLTLLSSVCQRIPFDVHTL